MLENRWRQVETLYHAAMARSGQERASFLDAACAGDEALRREVESLLADQSSESWLKTGGARTGFAGLAHGRSSIVGDRIGIYEIGALLGAGGMGEVYRARDTKLQRDVAIKVLPGAFTADPERLRRFEREAQLLAGLNHPNIATIYGLEEHQDRHERDAPLRAIVMELVEGETLAGKLARSPHALSIGDTLTIARQIADALAAAHEKGVIHRDLKPANIMITATGGVKVLDFGLAKVASAAAPDGSHAPTMTVAGTREGAILGTAAYMSPEQAQGKTVDVRSDVFSFGIVLYQMLTGRSPFDAATMVETLARILEGRPADLRTLRHDVPARLALLVEACLEKDRERRPSVHEIRRQLVAIEQSRAMQSASLGAVLRRRAVLIPAAVVTIAAMAAGGVWWTSGSEVRAARVRVPELLQLAERFDYDGFYRAARTVVPLLPDDLQIKQVWFNLTFPVTLIDSDPPGADVWIKGYLAVNAEWISIGRTPIEQVRIPFGATRIKLSKDGYAPFEGTPDGLAMKFTLDPIALVPEGMIHVRAGDLTIQDTTLRIPDYWMDRFEVTNQQFKSFIDAGGYRTRDFWKEPIVEDGRSLAWNDAMLKFRDTTGRAGPATWELGTYPDGQAAFPVAGVSWYEAAAYAVFAGKALPTSFQWRRAASGVGGVGGIFSDILSLSNFSTKGSAAVGRHDGLGPFGTYDMAGNVKEWCWNQAAGGRMILGGGWNESSYKYLDLDAQPALERLPANGIRLVKNIEQQPPTSYDEMHQPARDYSKEKPVDDASFDILRGLYRYDPRPLNAKVERSEMTPDWRRETVTLDAAYGNERVIVYVYVPKSAAPPYQTVVYFPGGDAPGAGSSRDLRLTTVDFIMRSGRALVFPVYKGTYERPVEVRGVNAARDVVVASAKDFGRVLELIDSRPDLDHDRIAFYGDSRGAFLGVMITALVPRLKASVLLGGGLPSAPFPPEIDPLNFAPRIRVPTLMVSGRSDFLQPVESAQVPLFKLLGVPAEHKRHALFDGGHAVVQLREMMREILDWFDRYLGPVTPVPVG